jgi:hypothetical protein
MNSRTIEVVAHRNNIMDIMSLLTTTGKIARDECVENVEFPWQVTTFPIKITLSKEGYEPKESGKEETQA